VRDAADRALRKVAVEGFEDSGVGLPPEKRARAKAITDRLAALGQQFDQRIRDDATKLAFRPEELAGVPEAVWRDKPRDGEGRVLLGLDSPTYVPVLERADRAATRERIWRAKLAEGGVDNLRTLDEILVLRREHAALFGARSYADFLLRRRMAGDEATAARFLASVKDAIVEREKRDLAELREEKARHLGLQPAAVTVDRWDIGYYTERLRRARYAVDQEAFRAHFPPDASIAFTMALAERLFGLRYERVPATLWHPDAQAFAVLDRASGRAIATLYLDLYPRDGKYNHAAVWPIRSAATRRGRAAQAALVVNMDRKGLSLEEMETLLHEFGHAVHNNVSKTRWIGTSSNAMQLDFIEAPSQMPESFVYDKRVLALFAQVCPTCKPIPAELIEKADRARHFAKGLRIARQQLFASYDLGLNGAERVEPMASWVRMEGETPLGHVQGTMLPAGFGHLANHYGAGYYGYLWSLVLAHDMRTAFAADPLDPAVGMRYRATILSQGRDRTPQQLLEAFLGRPTNANAFFEDLKR
jgi:thimet oligopeptidase